MDMHHIRRGSGKPLLLVHGLGGNWRSWSTILDALASEREVIAVDLPGFGLTPALAGEVSIRTLADAVTAFLRAHDLLGVDAVGSSMGARLVLELARRGNTLGAVVSLDPGGFWRGWQRHAFFASIYVSIRALRLLENQLPFLCEHTVTRSLLLAQFSARPWALDGDVVLRELQSYVHAPSFDELCYQLAYGEAQQGAPAGTITSPLVIGWGRRDRICFANQAKTAIDLFPDAQLHWFDRCGHFPHWDAPAQTTQLILEATARGRVAHSASTQSFGAAVPPASPLPV